MQTPQRATGLEVLQHTSRNKFDMKRPKTSYILVRTDQQLLQQERKMSFTYPASELGSVTSGKEAQP